MFGYNRRRPLDQKHRTELLDLCQAAQFEQLALPDHLRRDIGLDCGCEARRLDRRQFGFF